MLSGSTTPGAMSEPIEAMIASFKSVADRADSVLATNEEAVDYGRPLFKVDTRG